MSINNDNHIVPNAKAMEERYRRAQYFMQGIGTKNLVLNDNIYPFWIDDTDCFWYLKFTKNSAGSSAKVSSEYRLVDASLPANRPAFSHKAIAYALSMCVGQDVDSKALPITDVQMLFDPEFPEKKSIKTVAFTAFDQRWVYDATAESCKKLATNPDEWAISPDGRHAVFVRDFNLWLRRLDTGKEIALTIDGSEEFSYGFSGSGWGFVAEPDVQIRWSPDSQRIFTVQHDCRDVKSLPVVHHIPKDGSFRPSVEAVKIAYPGDKDIATFRLLSIHISTGREQVANYRQVSVTRNSLGFFSSNLGWWSTDNRRAYFIDVARDYKSVGVVEFDTDTGGTRVLFEETTDTQINLMLNGDELPTFQPLPETNELLWFSERSGWAHLYLYDLETGHCKNTVTQGEWVVRQVVYVDQARREAYIQTAGRAPERDPYYRDLCRIHLDSGKLTSLVSTDHDLFAVTHKEMDVYYNLTGFCHSLKCTNSVSPTGNFCVLNKSRADEVSTSFLVDRHGETILEIEVADISGLPNNWQWPEPVKVAAADGATDIFGLVFRPLDFSEKQTYPILTFTPSVSPDFPIVPKGSFGRGINAGFDYYMAAAMAELGFVVIMIDTRGSSFRSKKFKDESYGWLESACNLEDLVAGTQQLAHRNNYMDLDRVGILTSLGGPGGLQGLLQYPDFYKVGVSHQLHDSRLMSAPLWGDMYEGISGPKSDCQYPEEMVGNLCGKLLLIGGMLDYVTPPAGIFRVVEALQKANKDFDLLMLPNLDHDISSYVVRRIWDYLVVNLLDAKPPKEFSLTVAALPD